MTGSVYMGAPASVGVGPRGEVASTALLKQSDIFAHRVEEVTTGVFTSIGHSLANATAIESDNGLIIVDTGDCMEQAALQHADFRRHRDGEVQALVYTHNHYTLGARHYVAAGGGQIPVYGHEKLHENMAGQLSDTAPSFLRRACIQFGLFLPAEGPDAMPNHGIGPFLYDLESYHPTPGYVPPTHPVGDGQQVCIDGVDLTFFDAPSDTDDTVLIWLPGKDLVINNVAWPAFFNIYTLRGSRFRNPLDVLRGLDLIRELRPEHLIGVHGAPIHGREHIYELVTGYRDAIQFVYDQTVRGINNGLGPDELVEQVRLPEALATNPLAQELYGEISFHVRQIYTGLIGWFGTDASALHPVPPAERSRRLTAAMGGPGAVEKLARDALDDGELSWAAELASQLVHVDPADPGHRRLKADALRRMGQVTTAANTRSWLLTQARELEGTVDTRRAPIRLVTADQVRRASPDTYVKALRYRLDGAAAQDLDTAFVLDLTDADAAFTVSLRHGVLEVADGAAPRVGRLETTLDSWARYVANDQSGTEFVAEGRVLPPTDGDHVRELLGLFDRT